MGLVENDVNISVSWPQSRVSPNVVHYSSTVDTLGRAGLIHEAYRMIVSMQFDATASM